MREVLSESDIAWAYVKWCGGYTQEEIAAALNVSVKTLTRAFERRNLKKRKLPIDPPKKCP